MIKDYFGVNTNVGDFVVFIDMHYPGSLISGVVDELLPNGVRVTYTSTLYGYEMDALVTSKKFIRYPDNSVI